LAGMISGYEMPECRPDVSPPLLKDGHRGDEIVEAGRA